MPADDTLGQRIIGEDQAGAVALSSDVQHFVVSAAPEDLVITAPSDRKKRFLVLIAETGNFRIGIGDRSAGGEGDMPAAYVPAASVTNGTGVLALTEGKDIVLPAIASGQKITIRGYTNADVLTYYWL